VEILRKAEIWRLMFGFGILPLMRKVGREDWKYSTRITPAHLLAANFLNGR